MMMSEFIERTGFQPMAFEYEKIEEAYYNFDSNKDAFCKAFVEGGGEKKIYQARAVEIERLNGKILEMGKDARKAGEEYEKRLAVLQEQLDRELEWKPSERTGTHMSQKDYEDMAALCDGTHGDPHEMTDDEAKKLIASEFGFAFERIQIIHVVHTYEVNKHNLLRKAAEHIRRPMYDVSDYNYVRFDVDCGHMTWMYEMVNGELRTYSC